MAPLSPLRILRLTFGASDGTVQNIRAFVIVNKDASAIAYNKAQLDTIQLVGITGALFATVTVTSLQTPVLDNIHWTVTAAWTSTLVIASFSVFTSYNVYKALAGLTTAENLKRFYSGLSPDILKYRDYIERMDKEALNNVEDFGPYFVAQWIDIPRLFMYLTIMGYLLGLGLLWLLQWKGPYDAQGLTTRETSRNVFVVFICALGVCTLYTIFSALTLTLNNDIVGEELGKIVVNPGVAQNNMHH